MIKKRKSLPLSFFEQRLITGRKVVLRTAGLTLIGAGFYLWARSNDLDEYRKKRFGDVVGEAEYRVVDDDI